MSADLNDRARACCRALLEREGVPGLAAALVRGEEVLFLEGFGRANLEHGVPVTGDTVFEIASVTKLFTAEAVLLLVQEGELGLDEPLGGYLELPAAWQPVTVRNCLTHQSGLRSYTEVAAYWRQTKHDLDPEGVLALVRDLQPDSPPGARYAYDNTGFYLLGLLLERSSGRSYDAFLRERIFAPLGMTATRANDYGAVVPGRAAGYSRAGGTTINKAYYSTGNTFAAGVLLSTARDLARWSTSLAGERLLFRETRKLQWTPHPSAAANERRFGFSVGLGWFLLDIGNRIFYGHNGGIQGFASALLCEPEKQLTAVVLCNGDWLAEPHALALELIALAA